VRDANPGPRPAAVANGPVVALHVDGNNLPLVVGLDLLADGTL